MGATDGLSLVPGLFAGAGAGAVQSATTQGLSLADGSQTNFDGSSFAKDVISTSITSSIPGLRLNGLTAGRGNYSAIEKQMYTKLGNGTVSASGISLSTYGKMTFSNAAQQSKGAVVQGAYNNLSSILSKLSSLVAGLSSSQKQTKQKK